MFDFPEKVQGCYLLYQQIFNQRASAIQAPTSPSAVECSTTELRSLKTTTLTFQNVFF